MADLVGFAINMASMQNSESGPGRNCTKGETPSFFIIFKLGFLHLFAVWFTNKFRVGTYHI
jgi:hypothetical protein